MKVSKGFRSAAPVLLLLVGAGVGCSLMLDTEYDKYGPLKGAGGTAGATGGTGGTSTEGGTPDGDPGGTGGVGGIAGQGGDAGDSGTPDADAGGTDADADAPPLEPPPPGEVCPFWSPPSCAGGLTCAGRDCCESRSVPGGVVAMGDPSALGATPEHDVTVNSLCVDTFEVTVGRFRKFVESYDLPEAGAGAHPSASASGWNPAWNMLMPADEGQLRSALLCSKEHRTWTDTEGTAEDLPMNCVTWHEAFAFCAWDGGRLASEAEWEYVAAADGQDRLFPWGTAEPNASLANYCSSISGTGLDCLDDTVQPRPVGMAADGVSLWGQLDLAGNVWEWNMDWFSQAFYQGFCTNCVNYNAPGATCAFALLTDARVARGGAYSYGRDQLRSFARGCNIPAYRGDDVGFRCVRDL
jgi:formylglycine-generating enzyme required for sulfatase activity